MVDVEYTDFNVKGYPRKKIAVVFKPRMVGDFRQGSYMLRADNRRHLGWVIKDAKKPSLWTWRVASDAFRGDGVDDTGLVTDEVPNFLTRSGAGYARPAHCGRQSAAEGLVRFLVDNRAPAVGYGRHPDVRRAHAEDEEMREWAKSGYGELRTKRSSTRTVINLLHRSVGLWDEAWQAIPLSSVAVFQRSACAYLGDKTEVRTETLRRADWEEVFRHFLEEKARL